MNREELIQNLRDAGCGEETVSSFLGFFESGESAKAQKIQIGRAHV